MKRLGLASVVISLGAYAACAVEEPPTADPAVGGTSPTAGVNPGGNMNGGSAGASNGGAPTGGLGGSVVTGGSGGSVVTGGSGGSVVTGGSAGSAGSGGAPLGGTGGDAGGPPSGSGGMPGGSGGMPGGSGGMPGGSGGSAGSGGAKGTCPTVAELFPVGPVGSPAGAMGSLDGRLIFSPCADNPNTDDCGSDGWYYNGVRTACANGQLTVQQDFRVGGVAGTTYQVRMHFYGVMEPKNYGTGGGGLTREAGTGRPGNQNTGATPTPWATANMASSFSVPTTTYNTYEIHVFNNTGTANANRVGQYFINADTQEGHYTYVINYEKTIPVIGGGTVRMRTFDSNCRQIKNCGATAGYPCASKARSIDIAAAAPAPGATFPMGLSQPGLGETADHSGQWFLTDVVAVTCM